MWPGPGRLVHTRVSWCAVLGREKAYRLLEAVEEVKLLGQQRNARTTRLNVEYTGHLNGYDWRGCQDVLSLSLCTAQLPKLPKHPRERAGSADMC